MTLGFVKKHEASECVNLSGGTGGWSPASPDLA